MQGGAGGSGGHLPQEHEAWVWRGWACRESLQGQAGLRLSSCAHTPALQTATSRIYSRTMSQVGDVIF